MGISVTSDFLFGVIIGGLLVLAGQPLLRSLGNFSKWIPMLLLIGVLAIGIVVWVRS